MGRSVLEQYFTDLSMLCVFEQAEIRAELKQQKVKLQTRGTTVHSCQ
jgi:hypothetical protein